MIDPKLLIEYGAVETLYGRDDYIFKKDQSAKFYFQVFSGEVKMNNFSEDGKEFTQGLFSKGRSFGEPPLFGNFNYPSNAQAAVDSVIFKLGKAKFEQLLTDKPDVLLKFTKVLAERLYYKAIMAVEISSHESGHRILALIDYLKNEIYKTEGQFQFEVKLTRQEIANLTGLRVETVIRTIKALEKEGQLQIRNRKILR